MKIKKNDIVQVMTGKNRGKSGKVLRVYPETNKPTRVGKRAIEGGGKVRFERVAKKSGTALA